MKIIKIMLFIFSINFILYSADTTQDITVITKKAKTTNIDLTIFFTNDTNGHPLNFKDMEQEGQGGIPARAALIKKLSGDKTDKNKEILILDTGGYTMGLKESNLYNGLTDVIGMNSTGYYASGIGSSEIWDSLKTFENLNNKADFYFLCANLFKNSTKQKKDELCDKYIIKKIGGINGLNIGIFSVISDDVANEISETAKKEFLITDPIEKAKEVVNELKNEKNKVDIIIAVTYLGYYPDDSKIGSKALASSVNGIDIIIDGRTGILLNSPVEINNTKIFQAYKWGLFLGEINLKIADNKISDLQYKVHPINYKENGKLVGEPIEEDSKVLNSIKTKMFNFNSLLKKNIAKLPQDTTFDVIEIRNKETEIGNLICDALLDFTGADVAFQNSGGINNENFKLEEITRGSFDSLIKYDNSVVVLNILGEEIIKILEYSMSRMGYGSFMQVGGLSFTYSKSKKEINDVKIKDRLIKNSNFYKVAINSWLSEGGDGYDIFKKQPNKVDLHIMHREVLYRYIEKKGTVKPSLDGRINIIE